MSGEQAVAFAAGGADQTKEELQRRMEQARESISQTVMEIRNTVTDQYQSVKESVAETLDWREQYRRHPLAWSAAALAAGALLGYGVAENFRETEAFRQFQEAVGDIQDQVSGQVSDFGTAFVEAMTEALRSNVAPAVAGVAVPALAAVALPMLTGQIKAALGLDLTPYSEAVLGRFSENKQGRREETGHKKKRGKTPKGEKQKKKKASKAAGDNF